MVPALAPTLHQITRPSNPPIKLQDHVTHNAKVLNPIHTSYSLDQSSETVQGNSTWYPLANFVSNIGFSPLHQAFLASLTAGTEPTSFLEAVKDKVWRGAISNEIDALKINNTWDIEMLPPSKDLSESSGSSSFSLMLMG